MLPQGSASPGLEHLSQWPRPTCTGELGGEAMSLSSSSSWKEESQLIFCNCWERDPPGLRQRSSSQKFRGSSHGCPRGCLPPPRTSVLPVGGQIRTAERSHKEG